MRLPSNVVNFAQTDERLDAYKQFVDYYNHKNNKVGYFDSSVAIDQKKKELDLAIRSEIAFMSGVSNELVTNLTPEVLASHPTYQWASFAVVAAMVDAVLPQTIIDSIGLYTDMRFGGFGDSFSFDIEARDLFVVSKHSNGINRAHLTKQYKGQVNIIPENRQISVYTSLYKVLSDVENMADFAMKAAISVETQMTRDAYSAFNTAMEALDNSGDDALRFTGYTQSKLVSLCQKVSAYNGGKKAVIVGTQLALQNILPANTNYRYDLQSDYITIGYIKEAFGCDVMMLPQVASGTDFTLQLDDNNVYVMCPSGDKLIKGALEGSMLTRVVPSGDTADSSEIVTFSKRWGFAVATSSIAGLIELS